MALAEKVEKVVFDGVTLTLSAVEAVVLREVCSRIGGACQARYVMDDIAAGLEDAGVAYSNNFRVSPNQSSIYFVANEGDTY